MNKPNGQSANSVEVDPQVQARLEAAAGALLVQLSRMYPHLGEDVLAGAAINASRDMLNFQPMLQMLGSAALNSGPVTAMRVGISHESILDNKRTPVGSVSAPLDVEAMNGGDPSEFAAAVGIVASPLVRGLLYAHGYRFDLRLEKEPPQKSGEAETRGNPQD